MTEHNISAHDHGAAALDTAALDTAALDTAALDTATPARRWVILVIVGLVGGVLSGLLGVGGGILMVPLLVGLAGMDQRRAAATSLAAIVPTAIVGSANYLLSGQIDLVAGMIVAVGAVSGAMIGSALLARLSLVWLRWMFIALIVIVAIRMLLVTPMRGETVELTLGVVLSMLAVGLVMGIASGLFGIGGGLIAVPALIILFGASDLVAKGTSLLIMIPTAITGTLRNRANTLIDLPSALVVGTAATAASFGGVALALWLTAEVSNLLFVGLLVVASVQLSVQAIRKKR
ncbi:sulfite exporter TauE/SafE family protein [Leifsonia kafniensis]|uniref:Probable membrane transporter protein n=1 Tax=Leifsonia kafniensis TaxID=475957 RepID=A0ABP7KXK9_9MICO